MSTVRSTNDTMRWWSALLVLALVACEQTHNLVSSRFGNVDAGDGAFDAEADAFADADTPPDGAANSDGAAPDASLAWCGDIPCACANNKDDDGDGHIDGFDAECTGPYDNDEATFATGEMKEANPKCVDCFFDGNSRSNDDDCRVAAHCIEDGTPLGAPGACPSCRPSAQCVNSCLVRTPNGCDCFGCCEIVGAPHPIRLVDTCSLANINDPTKCPSCKLADDCRNPCERCELCPGKTVTDLPSECASTNGENFSCYGGKSCQLDRGCSTFEYCIQGCCVPVPLVL